jgi:hypothetical protein
VVAACALGQAVPASAAPAAAAGAITTIAGGIGGPGPARSVSIAPCGTPTFRQACGVGFAAGRLYFTDITGQSFNAGVVRSVALTGGGLTTPAGDGLANVAGDGGPAGQAGLTLSSGVSFDHSGNMLISDLTSVRVVARTSGAFYGQAMTTGHIYTVAGGGGSTQNGVPATTAAIKPQCVTVDHAGNIVICGSQLIRVVAASTGTFYGQAMTAGDIYTVAGGGTSGNDGVAATSARMIPFGAAIDAAGNLLIADTFSPGQRVRVVAVTTRTFYGQPMTAGDIYTVAGGGTKLKEKVPATDTAMSPFGLAVDKDGNVIVADFFDNLVRVVAARTGTFYGQTMKAGFAYAVAGLRHPRAVTTDSAGNVIVASQGFHMHAVAERTGTFYGVHMTAGHLYAVAGNGRRRSSGSGGPATKAELSANGPVAYDGGNLVISGAIGLNVVPGRSGTFFGHSMKAGHVYLVAGNGKDGPVRFGVPATMTPLGGTGGLAVDAHGDVLISAGTRIDVLAAHAGTFYGQRMKTGYLYKIAGNGNFQDSGDGGLATKAGMDPGPIVVDGNGNVVLTDVLRIRVVAARTGTFYGTAMTAGHIYTIAGDGTQGTGGDGGPAKDAEISAEDGVTLDGNNGILLSDRDRVRMIATATGTFFGVAVTAGDIYTVAGTGNPGTSADGGQALTADLSPDLLTVDKAGNLVLYDDAANKIRVVPETSGTFYGQAMTADHLYSIAGGGNGSLGEGGPGTGAIITFFVRGLAHGSQGIVFTDESGIRVRMVAG